jgi:hypothetical protein
MHPDHSPTSFRIASHLRILKDPVRGNGGSNLGHPAVTIAIEPWTAVLHDSPTQEEINKAIIDRFRAAHSEFLTPVMTRTV